MLLTSFSLLLALASAVDYQFTDVAVYGLDRCLSFGVGPNTDLLSIESPFRPGKENERELAKASLTINKHGELIANASNGGVVGLVRRGDMIYPDRNFRSSKKALADIGGLKNVIVDEARTNDIVAVFIPHTTRHEISRTDFYKAFNGRESMDNIGLVEHFVGKHTNSDDAVSRRFTLIVARIKRFNDSLNHRLTIIPGPGDRVSNDGSNEAPLSFVAQPRRASSRSAVNVPAHQVSQGVAPPRHTGQTQVLSNHVDPGNVSSAPLSFAPRRSGF